MLKIKLDSSIWFNGDPKDCRLQRKLRQIRTNALVSSNGLIWPVSDVLTNDPENVETSAQSALWHRPSYIFSSWTNRTDRSDFSWSFGFKTESCQLPPVSSLAQSPRKLMFVTMDKLLSCPLTKKVCQDDRLGAMVHKSMLNTGWGSWTKNQEPRAKFVLAAILED